MNTPADITLEHQVKYLDALATLTEQNERLREAMWKAAREMQGVGVQASREFHRLGLDSAYQILQAALASPNAPEGEVKPL